MAQRQTVQTSQQEVFDPRGDVDVADHRIANRVDSLEGKTLGLLDNAKSNADILLDELGEILKSEYGVTEVVSRRKNSAAQPADSMATQLDSQCDVVINAYGDCGSCTSWCIYDSIDLEKKGTPTATGNSNEFVRVGRSESQGLWMPGLPVVTVPHPMGDIDETEVRKRAQAIVSEVVTVLTGDRDDLEEEYENKFLDSDEELESEDLYCPIY
jgi:hypothetical protein